MACVYLLGITQLIKHQIQIGEQYPYFLFHSDFSLGTCFGAKSWIKTLHPKV